MINQLILIALSLILIIVKCFQIRNVYKLSLYGLTRDQIKSKFIDLIYYGFSIGVYIVFIFILIIKIIEKI